MESPLLTRSLFLFLAILLCLVHGDVEREEQPTDISYHFKKALMRNKDWLNSTDALVSFFKKEKAEDGQDTEVLLCSSTSMHKDPSSPKSSCVIDHERLHVGINHFTVKIHRKESDGGEVLMITEFSQTIYERDIIDYHSEKIEQEREVRRRRRIVVIGAIIGAHMTYVAASFVFTHFISAPSSPSSSPSPSPFPPSSSSSSSSSSKTSPKSDTKKPSWSLAAKSKGRTLAAAACALFGLALFALRKKGQESYKEKGAAAAASKGQNVFLLPPLPSPVKASPKSSLF